MSSGNEEIRAFPASGHGPSGPAMPPRSTAVWSMTSWVGPLGFISLLFAAEGARIVVNGTVQRLFYLR